MSCSSGREPCLLFICGMLAVDLDVLHRAAHEVARKDALIWTGFVLSSAILFNVGVYLSNRSLSFVLARYLAGLKYLKPGLAGVLSFVGTRMLLVDVYMIHTRWSAC